MNSKWYISTLIIILSILGAVSHQGTALPNQEIVLQFSNNKITLDEAQNAISTVKYQLHAIGVDNIQVLEQGDGRLKIIYYSDTDVASIKKILSSDQELELGFEGLGEQHGIPNQLPSENQSDIYDLKIYEIHDGSDATDFGGKFALELKVENDRFFNPYTPINIDDINDREHERIENIAFKLNRHIAIAIDNISGIIPEVRAGPILLG